MNDCSCGKQTTGLLSDGAIRDDGLRRTIAFRPGYECSRVGPKSHGVHGMTLLFVLSGPKGATQFVIFTNWLPSTVEQHHVAIDDRKRKTLSDWEAHVRFDPMGADVGFHAHVPQYEGQIPMGDSCEWLGGKPCYYDGSGLAAEDLLSRFLKEGTNAVWETLKARYEELVV